MEINSKKMKKSAFLLLIVVVLSSCLGRGGKAQHVGDRVGVQARHHEGGGQHDAQRNVPGADARSAQGLRGIMGAQVHGSLDVLWGVFRAAIVVLPCMLSRGVGHSVLLP